MKCDFCGHEVAPGTVECPYCHYQFKIEAQVLSSEERDTFQGLTIEEDGTASGDTRAKNETQNENAYDPNHKFGQQPTEEELREEEARRQQQPFQIKTYGCGSTALFILAFLVALSVLSFFMLPAFLIFAAIGAVLIWVIKLFIPF